MNGTDDNTNTTVTGVNQTGSDSGRVYWVAVVADFERYCFKCERVTPHRMAETTGGAPRCCACCK